MSRSEIKLLRKRLMQLASHYKSFAHIGVERKGAIDESFPLIFISRCELRSSLASCNFTLHCSACFVLAQRLARASFDEILGGYGKVIMRLKLNGLGSSNVARYTK